MAGHKTDLRNPIYHDESRPRASRNPPMAARPGLPALRRHGRPDYQAPRQDHPPRRLQVQGLPQALHRHGRHGHGAVAYPAVQVGPGGAPHGVEQEGHERINCTGCSARTTKRRGSCSIACARRRRLARPLGGEARWLKPTKPTSAARKRTSTPASDGMPVAGRSARCQSSPWSSATARPVASMSRT